MTGRPPSGQQQLTPLHGYPHVPYTFVPGYLRFQPAFRPAPAYASFPVAANFPPYSASSQPQSPMQAIQHGQEGPPGEKSLEPFYTLPKITPVKISKPEEPRPSQAMRHAIASSHTTSSMKTTSADKSRPTATTSTASILQELDQPVRSSRLNPLAPSFDASTHLLSPPSMGTSASVSNVPTASIIHHQPCIFDSMQVLPGSDLVLSSSVYFSSLETTPAVMRSSSIPPESNLSLKAKAESIDDDNVWISFDPGVPQPGARAETITVQQPEALLQDQDQGTGLEKTLETDHEPLLLRTAIGDGFWAVLALYVERDVDVAQSRFSDLEGRLISDYRDHTPQELGELVAETIKDEKEMMEQ
ncbi:hypothetical protein BG006_010044 [Podila minutissima]|uniref:Uncharacterized protein n=1 Tax=Podila minutissima TaxID=64525 RepID=A0A9P5VPV1_9FUNG|nr:hypothetical protein BG006_010044 [Podila minutissima]